MSFVCTDFIVRGSIKSHDSNYQRDIERKQACEYERDPHGRGLLDRMMGMKLNVRLPIERRQPALSFRVTN